MEEKKKFNPLAKDWLMGDVGKESDESQEEPEVKEAGFKNILEDEEVEEE